MPPAEGLAVASTAWLPADQLDDLAKRAVSATGAAIGSSSCCSAWTRNRAGEADADQQQPTNL
jgi:hypothetical protein